MNIISGEKWQDLCQVGISKKEHRTFESSNKDSLWLDKIGRASCRERV